MHKEDSADDLIYAGKEWSGSELDAKDVEDSLKTVLTLFDKLAETSSKYAIDEVKISIGLIIDEQGKLKAGLGVNLFNTLKGTLAQKRRKPTIKIPY
ncbi:MAG: hypothetical protein FWH37_04625 [Candidatus Bathyarchaeota archaeon]|nr:hypothetical protein [Candidatus Termiticorpusculum sp.]